MANGFWMLVSDLETARSVKLLAFGTPFHGQSEVWRSRGEAEESVARNEAMKARANMSLSQILDDGKWNRETCFYILIGAATTPQLRNISRVKFVSMMREDHDKLSSLRSAVLRHDTMGVGYN